jgi:catechol 2,3-dioxygenase-like lactoylglutathione lyase family enzyme
VTVAVTTETPTATATRFHVGLHSSDLDRSVRFYRALFGVEPIKHLPDYARFETDRPALVLGLYPSPQPAGGALNHVGLRFPDSAELVEVQRRLEEAGIATQRQEGVECCYARQTKFWVTDPDRVLWEVYTLHEDIDHSGFDDPPPPQAPPATAVWEHRLTDPVPPRIPHPDGALDEVMLEGTFNAAVPPNRLANLLAEAFRVLRPGGRLSVHGLVGDKPFPGTPTLPGMAALVQRVPVETEPLGALLRAGFGGLFYERLGDIHCFSVSGVELRELRLHGWKPGGEAAACAVLYKGPFEHVACECGMVFRRGEKVAVSAMVAGWLRAGPAADQFAFLPPS